ncbi:PaaI family thioesterase [Granulosicoccus sp.]|nr:PaaI family thioesterase [Granulosicoccus sp.]MDB4223063.1 PaaI family thioesterase [Granulosicoccus sp.]
MTNPTQSDGIIVNETGAQRLLEYVLDVGQSDKMARCRLTVTDDHLNRHDSLHGGITSAVLDNAMGATASLTADATGRVPFMTISLNTQFLAPARKGDQLTATGKVVGGGKSIKFVEGQLLSADGRIIATATGVFKRVPKHRLSDKDDSQS